MNDVPPQVPAGQEKADYDARLAACTSSYRLFSLDPDVVLSEAAVLLADLAPGIDVQVLALSRLGQPLRLELPPAIATLVDKAMRTLTPAVAADGTSVAQPLVAHHAAGRGGGTAVTAKAVGVAIVASPAPLPAAALSLVAALADRTGVALEHALLYEIQAQIAQQLQQRLLPQETPAVAGLEIGIKFCPRTLGADIGGDFIDFLSLSPNQLAVSVGDVSGKGIGAAAVTVIAKYALRAITSTLSWPTSPGEALRDLHNAMQGQLDPESFVTVAFGLVDMARHTLSLASAGHPAPYIIRGDAAWQPMVLTAPAIALVDYSELEPLPTERLPLEQGDTLLFFTDGLTELRDAGGRFYEEERLPQVLAKLAALPPGRIVKELYADALAFAERPPHDDIALVAVHLTA